jgi:glycosyltransferase involved in cell wall biosynthesis
MKVLVTTLTDDPLDPPGENRYGGAQLFMFDVGRHLARSGHEVHFLTRRSRPGKPRHQSLGRYWHIHRVDIGSQDELTHHDLWQYRPEIETATATLMSRLLSFDAVLSFNWLSGLAAKSAGIRPHVHHILSLGRTRQALREEPHPSDASRDAGEVEVFSYANRLVCVCRDELASMQQLYPEIDTSKCRIIPYGTDSDVFYRRPCDADDYVHRSAL